MVIVALDRSPGPDLLAHFNIDPYGCSVLVLESEPVKMFFNKFKVFLVLLLAPIVIISSVSSMRRPFGTFSAKCWFRCR